MRGSRPGKGRAARKMRFMLLVLLMLLLLPGCGGTELIERGFILGVAIDLDKSGKIALTSQFYKPASGSGNSGSFVNIRTVGDTMFDAIRNITLKLGRKAQWSHMQTILLGETLANSALKREALDFFYRDDEPRLTTRVVVTKGEAGRYLSVKPYIETSISRQNHEIERSAFIYSGKTVQMRLLDLRMQLDSKAKMAVVPYLMSKGDPHKNAFLNGAAIIGEHGIQAILSPREVQSFLILSNKYERGLLILPCGNGQQSESFEVVALHSGKKIKLVDNTPHVDVSIEVAGTVRELVCSKLTTPQDAHSFQLKVAAALEKQLEAFIQPYQKKSIDLLGVENTIYKRFPRQYERVQGDWSKLLASSVVNIHIKASLLSTGLENGISVFENGG